MKTKVYIEELVPHIPNVGDKALHAARKIDLLGQRIDALFEVRNSMRYALLKHIEKRWSPAELDALHDATRGQRIAARAAAKAAARPVKKPGISMVGVLPELED